MDETPLYLSEGRSCCFYVGPAGTVEAVTRNQERREREAQFALLESFENCEADATQDDLG